MRLESLCVLLKLKNEFENSWLFLPYISPLSRLFSGMSWLYESKGLLFCAELFFLPSPLQVWVLTHVFAPFELMTWCKKIICANTIPLRSSLQSRVLPHFHPPTQQHFSPLPSCDVSPRQPSLILQSPLSPTCPPSCRQPHQRPQLLLSLPRQTRRPPIAPTPSPTLLHQLFPHVIKEHPSEDLLENENETELPLLEYLQIWFWTNRLSLGILFFFGRY